MAKPDRRCLEKPFLKPRLGQIGWSFKGKSGLGLDRRIRDATCDKGSAGGLPGNSGDGPLSAKC